MTRQEIQGKFFLYSQQPPSLAKCYTPSFLMDSPFNMALKEAVTHGRCFPNIEKWALIEDILIEVIHRILAGIEEEIFAEDLLVDDINEAARKVRILLEAG